MRDLLRTKGTPPDELGLGNPGRPDDELIDAMVAQPILVNRPIIVTLMGTLLCRPSEAVLEILRSPQRGAFTKDDGEPVVAAKVVAARGQRVAR